MEVKIISNEIIRPASPTPPQLRYFNLSCLDQLSPHMFIPLILYYRHHEMGKATTTRADISRRLKTSLSQSLEQFYPLAGRFVAKENKIECNDQGVEFYESRVHYQLEDLLKKPNQVSLSELVPCYHTCTKYSGREDALLAVQANFFDCGGLALGVSLSHFIGDAATFVTFLNSWASTAGQVIRSTPAQKTPFVVHHHLFPHIPGVPRPAYQLATIPNTKRFVVDELNLAALRRKGGGAPTRVEAVTALVSRCMARATRKTLVEGRDERGFIVLHAVNLRRRMEPPLPDDAFGNFWAISIASPEGSPADDEEGGLEGQLRDSFKKVDALAKELQGHQGYQAMEAMMGALQTNRGKETAAFLFSSWCKFGYYEVDFGWGKPQWVSPALLPMKNLCLFLDQKEGDGVEVWANMEAEDMAKFEQDQELHSYVSPSYH